MPADGALSAPHATPHSGRRRDGEATVMLRRMIGPAAVAGRGARRPEPLGARRRPPRRRLCNAIDAGIVEDAGTPLPRGAGTVILSAHAP